MSSIPGGPVLPLVELWMRQKVEVLSLISKRLGLPDTIFSLGEVALDVV